MQKLKQRRTSRIVRYAACVLLAGVMASGCVGQDVRPQNLSLEEQATYQMLAAELRDFVAEGRKAKEGICVGVYRDSGDEPPTISAGLLQALENDVSGAPDLLPYSPNQCTTADIFGGPADAVIRMRQFAWPEEPVAGNTRRWNVGFSCGGLCGWGHLYEVEIDGSRVHVTETGDWIS